jgi:hypothetical protein
LLYFRGSVTVDLAAELNFFHFRAGPDFGLHHILLSDYDGFLVWELKAIYGNLRTSPSNIDRGIEGSMLGTPCSLHRQVQTGHHARLSVISRDLLFIK